jgi:cob(I)alamin adenosyltransferase
VGNGARRVRHHREAFQDGHNEADAVDALGEEAGALALKYVNRLSEFLFGARYMNAKGAADILWMVGQNR